MANTALSITDWEALGAFPANEEHDENRACEECTALRTQLAHANALLKTLRRLEAKPAKRETLDDDPATLEALGHAVYAVTIRTRIDLYLANGGRG